MSQERPVDTRPVLALHGISKTFGTFRALRDVDLEIRRDEIHGLLGENGSGKSTLIKILAGFHEPDEGGTIAVGGEPVGLPIRPGEFRQLGMAFVHQDLGLIPTLSVVENLRVRLLAAGGPQLISWRRECDVARAMFEEFGLHIEPTALVGELPATSQAMLAIIRALDDIRASSRDGRRGLLVLDETTVFLPHDGREQLLALLRRISRSTASILFVSHDLAEVQAVTDRVTVLRDGAVAGVETSADTSEARLVELIVGRSFDTASAAPHEGPRGVTAVSVQGLRADGVGGEEGLDFEIAEGEVLGLTGLVGSGFDHIPYLVFGALAARAGRVRIGEVELDLSRATPWKAISMGMALVPGDRLGEGSAGGLSVGENVSLQVLGRFRPLALRLRALRDAASGLLSAFDVRPDNPSTVYSTLSGGNQQKVLLAKWLTTDPKVLLLVEPTQGVDIGARTQIFSMIRAAAGRGTAILVASNDLEQIAAVCHRALVFSQGRAAAELTGGALTKSRLAEESFGSRNNTTTMREAG